MGAADKTAGIDALRSLAWAKSSPSLAAPAPAPAAALPEGFGPNGQPAWDRLMDSDRRAFQTLGWTAASYAADAGPTTPWPELDDAQRMAAMTGAGPHNMDCPPRRWP